ncbi:hypothetical protein ACIRBX_26815 [Kitasatospora sp. NPDC096147]
MGSELRVVVRIGGRCFALPERADGATALLSDSLDAQGERCTW